jgi:methylenetetrahydrofolate dehydrogenase (NADP+)/methenyltetrahydrofolate cyclohydrolase
MTEARNARAVNASLDGAAVAAEIRSEVAAGVAALTAAGGRAPGLAAVLVGDDPASRRYVGSKAKACEEVGMLSRVLELPADLSQADLEATVDDLNADPAIDGILVQLPLPEPLDEDAILHRLDPAKDVDGFHPVNVGHLWLDLPGFVPATPAGVMELLRRTGVELEGKHAVVVGRSHIVGKPMAALLLAENATVTVCHSRTRDLAAVCRRADVLVAAVGRPGMIGAEHVAPGAVVVDVGINVLTERSDVERFFAGDEKKLAAFERRGSVLIGDVDFHAAAANAAAITPVPGGVGPLTIAMLLVNTLTAGRRRQGLDEAGA